MLDEPSLLVSESGVMLAGAVDQGTSSTRFLVFVAETGQLVTYHQIPVQEQLAKHPAYSSSHLQPLPYLIILGTKTKY